ncbi:MAG TPA: nicotinamide riboside transporter PnuC [Leptospiraceae bacterium]|nr:nicotinamide riboside transporter PnuC [Leptospiraceae bacterium]
MEKIISITALVSGLICVVLAARGHIGNFFFGILNSAAYAYIAWLNGLFGEVGLNLIFFIPVNIAGIFLWKDRILDGTVIMKKMKLMNILYILAGAFLLTFLFGWSLSFIAGQNTPYIDASTNVLSVGAALLMIFRYREQWLFYILLNILTVTMWFIRFTEGGNESIMMMCMWIFFLLNSVYGYWNWSRGAE